MLGTSRALGTSTGTLCYDADFFPFGGEHPYTNTCPQNYKFTGKERDPETDNDNFDARYYSSTYGRFLSADWSSTPAPVPYANLTNPQTLNLYGIVIDNPESFVDLDGHTCYSAGSNACTPPGHPQDAGGAPSQTVQPQPSQQAQEQGSARERATEAGEAALNLALAKAKVSTAAGIGTTSESGIGALGAAYLTVSASGNIVAASAQAIGAVTGYTKSAETVAEAASVGTSLSGMLTLAITGGNLNKAGLAAAAEGIVTSNPKDLATGGTVGRAAKAIDFIQNVHRVEGAITSAVRDWIHPVSVY